MDTKTVSIIGNIVKFGLGIAGVVICALILVTGDIMDTGDEDGTAKTELLSGEKDMKKVDPQERFKHVDTAVTIAIWSIGIAFVLAVFFAVFYFVTNIKGSMGALIGIAALAVVFIIAYSMSDGDLMTGWAEDGITANISKMGGAGIFSFFILIGTAVVAVLFTEVSKIIK